MARRMNLLSLIFMILMFELFVQNMGFENYTKDLLMDNDSKLSGVTSANKTWPLKNILNIDNMIKKNDLTIINNTQTRSLTHRNANVESFKRALKAPDSDTLATGVHPPVTGAAIVNQDFVEANKSRELIIECSSRNGEANGKIRENSRLNSSSTQFPDVAIENRPKIPDGNDDRMRKLWRKSRDLNTTSKNHPTIRSNVFTGITSTISSPSQLYEFPREHQNIDPTINIRLNKPLINQAPEYNRRNSKTPIILKTKPSLAAIPISYSTIEPEDHFPSSASTMAPPPTIHQRSFFNLFTVSPEEHRFPSSNLSLFYTTKMTLMNNMSLSDISVEPVETSATLPSINFVPLPKGETLQLSNLNIRNSISWSPFVYLSRALAYLEPSEYPIELLRNALWGEVPFIELLLQCMKMEAGFIAFITLSILLALFLPLSVLVYAFCQLLKPSKPKTIDDSGLSVRSMSTSWTENCRRRIYLFLMEIFLFLFSFGIVIMFVTNEQLSSAVQKVPTVIDMAFNDISKYVRNSNMQITYLLTSSIEQTSEALQHDLNSVEELLGRPIQTEIAVETGVDVAQEALLDVSRASQDIAAKVAILLDECQKALEMARSSQIRLRDLRRHVEATIRQCAPKDIPLCGTIDPTRLEITFKIDTLLTDYNLAHIRYLAEDNFTNAVREAQYEFQSIPELISNDTFEIRKELLASLGKHRAAIYEASQTFEEISRELSANVGYTRMRALTVVKNATRFEDERWMVGFYSSISLSTLWLLILIGISSGCCGGESKAGIILHTTIFLICLCTLILWAIAALTFVLGGHGEIFICKSLYDAPHYKTLTMLFDNPGLLYEKGGFFSNALNANETLDLPIQNIIRQCERNQPLYNAFKLRRMYDVEMLTSPKTWTDFQTKLVSMKVHVDSIQLMTPKLQRHLQELLQVTSHVNLTYYRNQLSGSVTGSDLVSFWNQLENVASQIMDLTTVSRLETLASRTKKLIETNIEPLERFKETIIYLLTALEVQIAPLEKQANQSMAHLKTIQYYVSNHGTIIATQKTKEFTARILNYLDQFRKHVLTELDYNLSPCKPVWDVFDSARVFACRHVIDPLNGFWFGTVWCLLLLLCIVPLAIKLAACYNQIARRNRNINAMSDSLITSEMQTSWQTPPAPPMENDGW